MTPPPALSQLLKANDAEAAFLRWSKRSGVGVPLVLSGSHVRCQAADGLRGGVGGGAERVGLKVQFLLQDPGEDELGGDDGDRRRHGASTQVPVFFT